MNRLVADLIADVQIFNQEECVMEETLFVDERSEYTKGEVDLLNMEVTPEVQDVLDGLLLERAGKEADEWYKALVGGKPGPDPLDEMVQVQEDMAVTMEVIELNSKLRQQAWDEVKACNRKWQDWVSSPNTKKRFTQRQIRDVWFRYNSKKKQLEFMAWAVTQFVRDCWSVWNELKGKSDDIAAHNQDIWERYFNLKDTEINRYWTTGETEDVDDYQLITRDSYDVLNLLWETHREEMKDFEAPELKGSGFWSYGQEYRAKSSGYVSQAAEDVASQDAWIDFQAA